MNRNVHRLLTIDHQRLNAHLTKAFYDPLHIDCEIYDVFRGGLLRHIGIEEKFLFPALRKEDKSKVDALLKKLHVDHAALAAILVLSPNIDRLKQLTDLLQPHNAIEENAGGLYELCDRLPIIVQARLSEKVQRYPQIALKPCLDTPLAIRHAEALFQSAICTKFEV